MDKNRVYTFGNGHAEGKADMRNLLGGKGANLAEMNLIGVPVPPGFTITTEVCNAAARHRAAQLGIAVIDLEELKTGLLVHRLKVIMKAE